jgi:sigma-B regulation protein RsbU (phosphoserine phosphatase)
MRWTRSSPSLHPTVRPPEQSAGPDWAAFYDQAACGLLVTAHDGTIHLVNQTFCTWLGVERESLVGKRRLQDLLTMGGRIFHQTHWAPLLQIQGSVAEVKLDLLHADGHAVPMVMNAVAREHCGERLHELALFVATDRHAYESELMRARKRAEDLLAEQQRTQDALALAETKLRMALESANLHLWEVDPSTLRRNYSPGFALLLGMEAPQEVSHAQFAAAVEPADLEQARASFARMLETGTDMYRAAYRLNGVDGIQRTVLATARMVTPSGGGPPQVVGLVQDITELARQRAQAEDRALFAEQMIGIVSHDLRNPLSTVRVGAQVLELGGLPPHQAAVLQSINRAVARAQRMINDLLDFTMARIGQGLSVDRHPIALHDVVAEHVDELSLAYPAWEIQHRQEGSGSVVADAHRLMQLIENLVSNAVAYGDAASAVVVTSRVHADGFSVSVHNGGNPIDAALLPTLFQPMVRGTDAASVHRSVGLGLYIVAEIARAHGGEVAVQSSADAGTTFVATFPTPVSPVSNGHSSASSATA